MKVLGYHKFYIVISQIRFLISQDRLFDVKNQGYFVISKNLFCDIKKSNL